MSPLMLTQTLALVSRKKSPRHSDRIHFLFTVYVLGTLVSEGVPPNSSGHEVKAVLTLLVLTAELLFLGSY